MYDPQNTLEAALQEKNKLQIAFILGTLELALFCLTVLSEVTWCTTTGCSNHEPWTLTSPRLPTATDSNQKTIPEYCQLFTKSTWENKSLQISWIHDQISVLFELKSHSIHNAFQHWRISLKTKKYKCICTSLQQLPVHLCPTRWSFWLQSVIQNKLQFVPIAVTASIFLTLKNTWMDAGSFEMQQSQGLVPVGAEDSEEKPTL